MGAKRPVGRPRLGLDRHIRNALIYDAVVDALAKQTGRKLIGRAIAKIAPEFGYLNLSERSIRAAYEAARILKRP
jgi:hypothetical protein